MNKPSIDTLKPSDFVAGLPDDAPARMTISESGWLRLVFEADYHRPDERLAHGWYYRRGQELMLRAEADARREARLRYDEEHGFPLERRPLTGERDHFN